MNDYIVLGGDEFFCFLKELVLKEFGNLESVVIEYIEYKKEILKNVDGRIGIKFKDELISKNYESDLILSENEKNINDNEENLFNNIKSFDSDKNKSLDKISVRESFNLGIFKREVKEKFFKIGDLGFLNSIIIFIVLSILICLLNFN